MQYGVAVYHHHTSLTTDERTTSRRMCIIPAFSGKDAQAMCRTMQRHLEGSKTDEHGETLVTYEAVCTVYTLGVNGHTKLILSMSDIALIADAYSSDDAPDLYEFKGAAK